MKTLALVGALALCVPFIPELNAAAAYDRESVLNGELWRLVTCQLAHFGIGHFVWNLGACALLGLAAARSSVRALLWCTGLSLALIPVVVLAQHPELTDFRGLSGVASALFAYVAWMAIARFEGTRRNLVLLAVALFVAKLGWETAQGTALFAGGEGFVVVPAAHAVGALIGCLVAAVASLRVTKLQVAWSEQGAPINPFR